MCFILYFDALLFVSVLLRLFYFVHTLSLSLSLSVFSFLSEYDKFHFCCCYDFYCSLFFCLVRFGLRVFVIADVYLRNLLRKKFTHTRVRKEIKCKNYTKNSLKISQIYLPKFKSLRYLCSNFKSKAIHFCFTY